MSFGFDFFFFLAEAKVPERELEVYGEQKQIEHHKVIHLWRPEKSTQLRA